MTARRPRTALLLLLALGATAALGGCGDSEIETAYGRTRGRSVNGTGAFANLLRQRGHEVRSTSRLNEEVAGWAAAIVRFAPEPGPIDRDEADWYLDWQLGGPGRLLAFVCRDGGAEAEYWAAALARLPADAPPEHRDRIERRRDRAPGWGSGPPPPGSEAADPDEWFALDEARGAPGVCRSLSGPWAEGIDPVAAGIPVHRALTLGGTAERALLVGDGRTLAMAWDWEPWGDGDRRSAVLVVANGSFLLNAPLVNRARRPLALRVADWLGPESRNVAFVEGTDLLGSEATMPTPWQVVRNVPELGVVAAHFMALALVAALSRAVILGRPRPAPPSGVDRPRAHAEALGHLLAKLGSERASRTLLESYRRWRRPQAADGRSPPDADRPPA